MYLNNRISMDILYGDSKKKGNQKITSRNRLINATIIVMIKIPTPNHFNVSRRLILPS